MEIYYFIVKFEVDIKLIESVNNLALLQNIIIIYFIFVCIIISLTSRIKRIRNFSVMNMNFLNKISFY